MKITNYDRQHIATALVLCMIAVAIYSFSQTVMVGKAQTSVNPHDDCPPNATANNMIWVHIDSQYSPTGQEIYRRIRFDTGTVAHEENINGSTVWVEYDNYIRGVLVGELADAEPLSGSNKWDPEMIKAMAIAIRTKAYHRCGWWARPDGTRYIEGQVTQEYRYDPTMRDVSDRTHQSYQNGANNTSGIYLGYQASTFDITFRDRTGLYTFDNVLPHKGVYDPVGHPWGDTQKTGMAQINANYWAYGNSQGYIFPQFTHRQILSHYYTGIHLRDFDTQTVTPAKRWNMLQHTIPSILPRGETIPISVKIQNTSTLNWGSSHFLAYRWKRGASVAQWQTTTIPAALAPGETSPLIVTQLNIPWIEGGGGYILEWDVGELLNNEMVWFSEQNLPETIEAWPTYSKSVAVVNPDINPFALDIYYVLDLSSSMGQLFEGAGNKLAAAKEAIMLANSFLNDATDQYPWMDNRVGLITFYGGQDGVGNPATYEVVTSNQLAWRELGWGGLTDDLSAFDNKLLALSANGSTPTYHALGFAKGEMELDNAGGRKPVIVLLSDGVPTISSERYSFHDPDVQAVPVRNADGSFRSIGEVRVDGGAGGASGYFNGEPLADVMEEVQQGTQSTLSRSSTDNLTIHTVAIQGVSGNTFQKDILDYVAAYGGGNSYEDDEVLDLGQSILDALLQSAYADGSLPTPTPAPTQTPGSSPTPIPLPTKTPTALDCAVEWVIDYFGWGEEALPVLYAVRDQVLAQDESGVGQQYIELFELHTQEAVSLMAQNYQLAKWGQAVVVGSADFARPLIEPTDNPPKFKGRYRANVRNFLTRLAKDASPSFKAEIEMWQQRVETWKNKTAQEIWQELLELDG